MTATIEYILNHLQSGLFVAVFLDTLLKSLVVLALTGGICLLWRKASAATRHLIWFLAVASLPCLPLLSSTHPAWQKPAWTISSSAGAGNQISLALELAPKTIATPASNISNVPETSGTPVTNSGSQQVAARFNARWMLWGWLVWLAGSAMAVIRIAAGRFQRCKLAQAAQPLKDTEWTRLLQVAGETSRLRRSIILLQSINDVMPMTWGWRHPVVLLPAEAAQWPRERRRVVLLHELAHIKRQDYLTQMVAQFVCALYWFNPLVWFAARQMCVEREGACDDLVLAAGCKASDYAGHLVEIAGSFGRMPQMAAIAMARSSRLEGRIAAIVDASRNRRLRSAAAVVILAAVGGVAVCVGGRGTDSVAAIIGGPSLITHAVSWTNWNNGQSIGSFYAVAGTTNEVVAVGIDGRIATRNNATGIWKIQTFTGDPDFRAIVYANNQYVIVREAGFIMASKDGLKWQSCNSPTHQDLLGLNWVENQYLAGGNHGTILSSPDGINWTSRNSGSDISFYSFSYSGSRYVAVGMDGIRISSNSITWTAPTTSPDSWVPFTGCTWTGSEFLACGLGLDKNPTIYTSPDGDVWTLRDTTITASLRATITINGTVYVAGDSVVAKSDDGGTTWINTFKNTGGNRLFMGLASDGKYLIAAGFNHNVWAMPLSETLSSASSKDPVFQLRLVLDAPADNTELMTNRLQHSQEILNVDKTVLLDQTAIQSARQDQSPRGYQEIEISLTDTGRKQFAEITRQHLHQRLAIIVNGQLLEAPVIQSEIATGKAQITGSFSENEAKMLAAKINEDVGNSSASQN